MNVLGQHVDNVLRGLEPCRCKGSMCDCTRFRDLIHASAWGQCVTVHSDNKLKQVCATTVHKRMWCAVGVLSTHSMHLGHLVRSCFTRKPNSGLRRSSKKGGKGHLQRK